MNAELASLVQQVNAELAWLNQHRQAIRETANAFRFMLARHGSMVAMLMAHRRRDC